MALLVAYGVHVTRTIKKGDDAEEEEPKPLYFDTSKDDPPNGFQLGGAAAWWAC